MLGDLFLEKKYTNQAWELNHDEDFRLKAADADFLVFLRKTSKCLTLVSLIYGIARMYFSMDASLAFTCTTVFGTSWYLLNHYEKKVTVEIEFMIARAKHLIDVKNRRNTELYNLL